MLKKYLITNISYNQDACLLPKKLCPSSDEPFFDLPFPLIYLEHFVPPPDDLVLFRDEFLEIHHLLFMFKDLVVEFHYLVVLVHDLGIHLLDPALKDLNTSL